MGMTQHEYLIANLIASAIWLAFTTLLIVGGSAVYKRFIKPRTVQGGKIESDKKGTLIICETCHQWHCSQCLRPVPKDGP